MAKTQMDKDMDAIFRSDTNTGKLALTTMAQLVIDLAGTRNSDPLRRFITKARNHHHATFTNVINLLIRCYFGDKMLTHAKDDAHPTGTSVKFKFDGNPVAKNGWGMVIGAIQAGKSYNDRAFLKQLREHLSPEKVDAAVEAQVVAIQRKAVNLVKYLGTDAKDVSIERVIAELRQAWKDEHPTGIVSRNPTASAEVIEIEDAA
jgi:hypothetical protein